MKEMKLISMTELVLNAGKYLRQHTNTSRTIAFAENRLIKNYAQFLSQPLELGMFIPCVDGVPIDEPKLTGSYVYTNAVKLHQYQQAKDKVLFEGFEIVVNDSEYITITQNGTRRFMVQNGVFKTYGRDTVEDMIPHKLVLTQSAFDMINIK